MKSLILCFLFISACDLWALDQTDLPHCPIVIVPGHSFGPIVLGMDRASVMKLGKKAEAFTLQYDEKEKVQDVGAEISLLPDCLFIGKQKIKTTLNVDQIAKFFKNCGDDKLAAGGSTTYCELVWLQTTGGWRETKMTSIIRTHKASYGQTLFLPRK